MITSDLGGRGEISSDKRTISLLNTVWGLEFLFGFFNKNFSLGRQEVVLVSCCLSTLPMVPCLAVSIFATTGGILGPCLPWGGECKLPLAAALLLEP